VSSAGGKKKGSARVTKPVLLGHNHAAIGGTVFDLEPVADQSLARSLFIHGPLEAPAGKREIFLRRFVQLPGARHLDGARLAGPKIGRRLGCEQRGRDEHGPKQGHRAGCQCSTRLHRVVGIVSRSRCCGAGAVLPGVLSGYRRSGRILMYSLEFKKDI